MGSHELFYIVFSFFIGSFPTGFLICYLKEKKDIRDNGSNNIGATNVYRVCGKGPAVSTLVIDIIKGMIPVLYGVSHFNSTFIISLGGAFAIMGHMFSPVLKFRGGKGIATFTGFLIAFSFKSGGFPVLIVFSVLFITVLYFSGYVSLSSLAGITGSFFTFLFSFCEKTSMVILTIVILMVYKHRENIKRLLSGSEKKLLRRKYE